MFGDDLGPWYTPAKAAPMLGFAPKTVQQMCAAKVIECRVIKGPAGGVRYQISEQQIARFNRAHTQKADTRPAPARQAS